MFNIDFTGIIIVAVAIFLFVYIKKNFKVLQLGAFSLFTGGVKAGKTTVSVYSARREWRTRHFRWRVFQFFYHITKKEKYNYEEPLLYSNIPLRCKYVPLTTDILLRKVRVNYGSVIYINESSLVADSMSYKYVNNDDLLLFFKLIGHETCGGALVMDTQSCSDNHYSVKRCLSNYFYVQKLERWLPFYLIAHVRECRYSDDGSVVSVDINDLDTSTKKILIPRSVWRKFDCFCYSSMTDNLPVYNKVVDNSNAEDMKVKEIVSFKGVNK